MAMAREGRAAVAPITVARATRVVFNMGVSFFITVHASPITGHMNIGPAGGEKVRSFLNFF